MAKSKNEIKEKKRKRKIIVFFVAIFIILLLIKSCASEFNWTIGRIFGSASEHEITDESDKPIILNENLKFDIDENEPVIIEDEYKISFDIEKINPDEFTCTTSDANIATCYVKDGYVVVNPKGDGKVTIHVQATTNDKIYQASTTIDVLLPVGTFNLSQTKGTVVLSKTNKKIITYNINNIDGEVEAISNDENIATVSVGKGIITINAKKTGSTTIVVSVVDKRTDKKYQVIYKLDVVKGENNILEKPNQNENNPVTKDSNNYLEYIKVSNSKLNPQFDKNILNYNINVENNIDKIGFLIKQDSNKSTIKYIFNDKNITDISELLLNLGDNVLKVEVTSENNQVKTYTVIINRKDPNQEMSTYLKNLVINGYNLTPVFNKETNFYNLQVMYNQSSISLQYVLEDLQNNISFSINNSNITDLSNINLKNGNNILEIKINNSKSERIYIINIYKPVRTIEFYENNYDIYIEQAPFYINYKVLEDNIEINNYNIKDIEVKIDNFNGTYKIYQGYIEIIPNGNDANKNYDLSIIYNNISDIVKLNFLTKKYYINTPTSKYDISFVNGSGNKNIIINNNILIGDITKTNISNGFRLSTPNGAYIDIIMNDNLVDVNFDNDDSSNNSLVLAVKVLSSGTSQITVNGYILDNKIGSYDITFNIKEKYNVVIDANGGFFNSFTTIYRYLLEKEDVLKLEEYDAKKVSDEENCLFFTLASFNTKSDNTGINYNKDDILTNFDGDVTLYAIYTTTASYQPLLQNERLYLTEIDLFHNDEYYEKYNVDKIIYPSAEGAHVMSITNNGIGKIKINKINLEENTMCLSKGNCINIGYIIKSALDVNEPYTYFYGTKDSYTILNKDNKTRYTSGITTDYHTINNIDITPNIEIEVGETKEISILWKWVEVDDKLDTYFGANYSSSEDEYSLTISIDFERESTTCTLP